LQIGQDVEVYFSKDKDTSQKTWWRANVIAHVPTGIKLRVCDVLGGTIAVISPEHVESCIRVVADETKQPDGSPIKDHERTELDVVNKLLAMR
tara:strand:+ start:91 stop:369 length:279 start_codon:yes stop_codon:yes gene_type:complete